MNGSAFDLLGGAEVACGVQAFEVLGERQVVLVGGVGLDGGEDGVAQTIGSGDEAGDVVDVAVGVVAGAAAVEPDDLIDAKVVVEGLLQAGLSRLPGLRCWTSAEQALFRGEEDAGAVGVDAAAFEDEAVLGAVGERDVRLVRGRS